MKDKLIDAVVQLLNEINPRMEALNAILSAARALGIELPDPRCDLTPLDAAPTAKPAKKEPRGSSRPPRRKLAKGKPWSKKQHENYAATILAKRKAKKAATDKSRPKWANGEPVTTGEAAAGERIPKPTTPPSVNGSLSELTQKAAVLAILEKATRAVPAAEILDRLKVGGYVFRSEHPQAALSVTLATMRLAYETRAGKCYYQPIKPLQIEREA